ncbi:mannose-6-phosphate isomerase, class I [Nocardioides sp. GY 10127]|uniref:mannose-6-phosphate isomerase, class I n=1 Tax=Nocardioides sp. GY 10127 TaxID=2569762 RepID=UPI0010A8C22D|nr:mannose-6-phosphate isomerase, class I [Nocardioides sp. GY 10127]TIC78927.1 mannose-6-phosphate isomerase, class I [Nocardioides sp. GY 10127]
MHLLDCPSQDYAWGTAYDIPSFLGRAATGQPMAEVWMGTHPLGEAMVQGDGGRRPLSEVAGQVPFMMKILSAARPLSIQVHPNASLAREGFADEEARGVPLDSPERLFKDPNPKPEMVYALTTFDTLVGFRPTAEILRILSPLEHPVVQKMVAQLTERPGFRGIVRVLERLLEEPPTVHEVHEIVALCHGRLALGLDIKRAYASATEIAPHYPGDVGVVVSLLLNRLTLQPGEAAYLGAGILHAHLHGMCVEVMVNSDNVLRAGLTPKHLAPQAVVASVDAEMSRLARVNPDLVGASTDVFEPGGGGFGLAVTQTSAADVDGVALPETGQRILVCTGGEVEVRNEHGQALRLTRGAVLYAGPEDGTVSVRGSGEVAQAYRPTATSRARRMFDLV